MWGENSFTYSNQPRLLWKSQVSSLLLFSWLSWIAANANVKMYFTPTQSTEEKISRPADENNQNLFTYRNIEAKKCPEV